jgi:hypothetical protein
LRRNDDEPRRLTREISNIEFVKMIGRAPPHSAGTPHHGRVSDDLSNLTFLKRLQVRSTVQLAPLFLSLRQSSSLIVKYQARTLRKLV